jgi:hypothetical protein
MHTSNALSSLLLQRLKRKQQKQTSKNKSIKRQNHKTKANHAQDKTQTSARRSSAIFLAFALPKSTQKELMKFQIDFCKLGEVVPRSDGPPSFSL